MKKLPALPDIPESEQTPVVKALLGLVEQLIERVQQQDEEIALLKDDINILKGEKKRPVFKGSKLDKQTESGKTSGSSSKKRPGSGKKKKTQHLVIHEEKVIKPDGPVPAGSRFNLESAVGRGKDVQDIGVHRKFEKCVVTLLVMSIFSSFPSASRACADFRDPTAESRFKGYRDFVVQDLKIEAHTIRYRLEHWLTPENESITGRLPDVLNNQHFGPQLIAYILYQYHHCQTTQPLLLEQLREWGIDLSGGQINQILLQGQDAFHAEKDAVLQAGLTTSSYVTVDDSGARYQGKNGFVTHIGNDLFGWFQSTGSKSRINFLELLRAGKTDYYLSESALLYMKKHPLPEKPFRLLSQLKGESFADKEKWLGLLDDLSITNPRHQRSATEGALLGSVLRQGLCDDLTIVSDDAGQFDRLLLLHALCWVHN